MKKRKDELNMERQIDILRRELNIVENLTCLSYDIKKAAIRSYQHKIDYIEKTGRPINDEEYLRTYREKINSIENLGKPII
jgi:hypothetical protein